MRKISMLTGLMSSLLAAPAIAQDLEVVGRPQQGGVGFQPAATELARDLQWLDGMLLVIITAISLFVGSSSETGRTAPKPAIALVEPM